jgi:hypothetical protein
MKMRIMDAEKDQEIHSLSLTLTAAEASELRDSLQQLINQPEGNHAHVSSSDYQVELTVVVKPPGEPE